MKKFDINFKLDSPFDIVSFGSNCIDYLMEIDSYPVPDSKNLLRGVSCQPGGQAATASVLLSRFGLKVKYIGKTGNDPAGTFSRDSLLQEGIDISSIIIENDVSTQQAFIIIDGRSGERTILFARQAGLNIKPSNISPQDIGMGKLLLLDDMDTAGALVCAEKAKKHKIPIILDIENTKPETPELISLVDFLICSKDFLHSFSCKKDIEQALRVLRKYNRGFICATLGKEGAVCLIEDDIFYSPSFPVHVVDTTGCGDIFHGAFAYALLQNWDIEKILKFSNICAGMKARKLGGRLGIPDLQDVLEYL